MIAYFNRFSIEMTKEEAYSVSHQGACDNEVEILLQNKKIKRQLDKIDTIDLINELKEYGAWENEELEDRQANEARIVWLAGGNIVEDFKNR